jgi:hypothetical protein
MIGTDSKWGNNSAYITGFDKSSMGTILKNLRRFSFSNFIQILIQSSNYFTVLIMLL